MEKDQLSRFRTLADTSSVVAHDLCAQLHVIQFCLDELSEHVDEEGKEYLKRMGTSTSYITNLIDSFRRGLKVSLTDDQGHYLSDIYDGFLELIKNHYYVVLEKIQFDVQGNLGDLKIKNQSRTLMHIFFALYSLYIDELKANQDEEGSRLSFLLKACKKNNRFASIQIEVEGAEYERSWLTHKLQTSVAEKGKVRQFLGISLLNEKKAEDEEFLTFQKGSNRNIIEISVPLEINN